MSDEDELSRDFRDKLRDLKFSANEDVVRGICELFEKECAGQDGMAGNVGEFVERLAGNGMLMRMQLESREGDGKGSERTWRTSRRSGVYSEKITPETFQLSYHPKDKETMRFLESILVSDIPFGFLNPEQKVRLVESMELVDVKGGTFVTQEGGFGSRMYIVDSGEFEVTKGGMFLRKLCRGSFFGEIALLHNIPRTATVRALGDGRVWVVEQTSFSGIRMMDRILNKRIILEGLKEHNVFPQFGDEDYESILSSLSFVYYRKGSRVEVGECEFLMSLFDGEVDDGVVRRVRAKEILRKGFVAVSAIQGAHIPMRGSLA